MRTMTDELRARLRSARLYLVSGPTDDASLDGALRGGVDLLQLASGGGVTDEDIVTAGRRFRAISARHGVPLLLNGRPDLVQATEADGVHLNADDGAVAQARAILGPEPVVGLWCKDQAQVDAAAALDVDYISVGPINVTPTLAGRPATGDELAAYAVAHSHLPVFAIGGIDASNVAQVLASGVTRIAVLRVIAEASDPERVAAELQAELSRMRTKAH
jgi:thiamine-phosphate pyrophosphorylase